MGYDQHREQLGHLRHRRRPARRPPRLRHHAAHRRGRVGPAQGPRRRDGRAAPGRRARRSPSSTPPTPTAPTSPRNSSSEALHPYAEEVVIATKAGLTRRARRRGRRSGDPSTCARVRDEPAPPRRRDGSTCSSCTASTRSARSRTSSACCEALQDEGKVRHIGLSEVRSTRSRRPARVVEIATVQNRYNLANRTSEEVLDYCEREGHRLHPVVPDRERASCRSGGPLADIAAAPRRDPGAARAGLAAASLTGDAADPWHVERGPPRVQHRCRRHRADRRGVRRAVGARPEGSAPAGR